VAGRYQHDRAGQSAFTNEIRAMMLLRVRSASQLVEATAKRNVGGTGTGVFYGSHQASAPGEPPALWTGNLRGSIGINITMTPHAIVGSVGSPEPYAGALEQGTIKMAPRPWLRRTLIECVEGVRRILMGSGK